MTRTDAPGGPDDEGRDRWSREPAAAVRRAAADAARVALDASLACGRELARLVLPVECAGCGALDVPWCPACRGVWTSAPFRCEGRAGRLDRLDARPPPAVWALADYAGSARASVVAWKDGGRRDVGRPLAAAARRAAAEVAGELGSSGWSGGDAWAVVPVPSSAAARRRRGHDPTLTLAEAVRDGLRDAGASAQTVVALRRRAGGRDQVGLSAREREANARGSVRPTRAARAIGRADEPFGPTSRAGGDAGRAVVLVDDVLTTGATFAACVDALAACGLRVTAGVVLASTEPPSTLRPLRVPGPRVETRLSRSTGRPTAGPAGARGIAWSSEPTTSRGPADEADARGRGRR